MKKLIVAALLAALIAVFPVSGAVSFAAISLDSPSYSQTIGNGIVYKEKTVSDSGGNQAVFYGEYKPDSDSEYEVVIHSIRNGSKTTLSTVMDIAEDYEKTTGRKVMLATNGDYFDFGSGSNMESYVNDGVVVTKGTFVTKHCIGFDNNGKVVAGRMTQTQKRLLVSTEQGRRFFEIDKYNEEPSDGEIAVYTAPGTYSADGAGKYLINTDSVNMNQFPVWGVSKRLTTGTVTNNDSFTVKAGQFAVVVKGENTQYFFDNVVYGAECSLVEIPDGDFKDCTWVLGGYDILVNNGTVNTKCHTDNDGNGYAPRTFIGFKEDGTAFLCVIDGRQSSYSKGITVTREAEIAKELGAQYALELDGGGSSTMIIRVDDNLILRNKPSDGSMRKVSNAVMIVEKPKTETVGGQEGDNKEETPPATVTPETPSGGLSCNSTSESGVFGIMLPSVLSLVFVAGIALFINRKGVKR